MEIPVASAVPPGKRKSRRIWYVLSGLFLLWFFSIQAGCLAMRTPDRKWSAELQKKGQQIAPVFHDIPVPGYRTIHAVSVSRSDTLPLVALVHGSPGSADAFLSYLADTALTAVARLVSVDRPGFGYTTGFGRPEGSLYWQSEALYAVVRKLANGRKVVLVGHSMGGPVIARFAMDHPAAVAGLILVAASIDPDLEKHPWWQSAVDAPPLCWLTPKSLWASNREILLLEHELRQMLARWQAIRCPVTAVHAADDRLVPFANVEFARKMLVNCPDFRRKTLSAGDHFILWSRQDVVRASILQLLTGNR
ncbi:MAG: alpha/beta fold hydrolase [Saprospirales bacterium]|jgi:pimeloyl-ACP methyl ester carboxylesterase|nr:alpha/beta fold hydrolase [Saprospirales bacterium]MBK8920572.1 alpha/beta fold hydrolase [Saprospirales bacterium]